MIALDLFMLDLNCCFSLFSVYYCCEICTMSLFKREESHFYPLLFWITKSTTFLFSRWVISSCARWGFRQHHHGHCWSKWFEATTTGRGCKESNGGLGSLGTSLTSHRGSEMSVVGRNGWSSNKLHFLFLSGEFFWEIALPLLLRPITIFATR